MINLDTIFSKLVQDTILTPSFKMIPESEIENIVKTILTGQNSRELTEYYTRGRIMLANASLVPLILCLQTIDNNKYFESVVNNNSKLIKAKKLYKYSNIKLLFAILKVSVNRDDIDSIKLILPKMKNFKKKNIQQITEKIDEVNKSIFQDITIFNTMLTPKELNKINEFINILDGIKVARYTDIQLFVDECETKLSQIVKLSIKDLKKDLVEFFELCKLESTFSIKDLLTHIDLFEKILGGSNSLELHNILTDWLIGTTSKSKKNIIRDNRMGYLKDINDVFKQQYDLIKEELGDLTIQLNYNKECYELDWSFLHKLFIAIGAQTLTIRGSEKSANGKALGRLILGLVLEILGGRFTTDHSHNEATFELENTDKKNNKREMDGYFEYSNKGIAFDIGFIGEGNSEITKDKLNRYITEKLEKIAAEIKQDKKSVHTIVIIDKIPLTAGTGGLLLNAEATIIQMSEKNWVKRLAEIIKDKIGYESEILKIHDENIEQSIFLKLEEIDWNKYMMN